jgi:hypothetical protein
VEGVDFEAGVVGEDVAVGVAAVVLGFEAGIAGEGGLVFFGSGDGVEVGERLNEDAAGQTTFGCGDGEVAEFAGVSGGGVEGERHGFSLCGRNGEMAAAQVVYEGAAFAAWGTAAVILSDLNHEGVEFVVVTGKFFGAFSLLIGGESLFGEGLDFGILCVLVDEGVANGDAAEVLVDDHGGGVERVEEDGVRRFGADVGEGEELLAHGWGIGESGVAEGVHAAVVMGVEEGDEGLEGGGFAEHEAGGANELAEFFFGEFAEAGDGEDAMRLKVGNGALDRFPGGVLGEEGADDDFKSGLSGPPLLGAVEGDEMVVERAQAAGGRGFSNRQVALCGFCGHGFDLTYWGVGRIVWASSMLL